MLAENGITYAAPNLVYHYVMECGYLPPDVFVEAVIKSHRPLTDGDIALLANRSKNWLACPFVEMVAGKAIRMPPRG